MHLLRAVSCAVLCCLALAALPSSLAYPQPKYQGNYYSDYEPQPDAIELIDMLNRLGNIIQMERKMDNTKRGLDLGLSRGYSGSLAAKHLMGLAAANFAGGPGRKRRDLTSA